MSNSPVTPKSRIMSTIGQQFKAAREAKGVTEADAGSATNIMTKTIEALEADDFSIMAAPTYAKGFIRLYAKYLDIDPNPLIEEYIELHAPPPPAFGETARPPQPLGIQVKRVSASGGEPQPLQSKLAEALPFLPGPLKDIRVLAGLIGGLILLTVLISSLSTCSPASSPTASTTPSSAPPAQMLLNEPLPDLYRVSPGRIEASRAH